VRAVVISRYFSVLQFRSFDVAANPPLRAVSVSRMFFFLFISLKLWTELRERIVYIGYTYRTLDILHKCIYQIDGTQKYEYLQLMEIRCLSLSKRYLIDPIISLSRIINIGERVFAAVDTLISRFRSENMNGNNHCSPISFGALSFDL